MKETVKDLSKMAVTASKKAVKQAKVKSVAITYLSGSKVVREYSDGSKETLSTLTKCETPTNRRFKL